MRKTIRARVGCFLFTVSGALPLTAQPGRPLPPDQDACPGGVAPVGGLGITDLSCGEARCHPKAADGGWDPRFLVEPEVQGIEKDRPADGALFRGDVLVAIDGQRLTSPAGGRRFANLPPDEPVTLTVRRDGALREVRIVTDRECWQPPRPPAPPTPPKGAAGKAGGKPGAPTPPAPKAPKPPAPPAPPAPPDLPPYAHLGFSFECGNCGFRPNGSGSRAWTFTDPPVVSGIEPGGPAAEAGLQPGDRLLQIGGVALNSPEGGRHFTHIQPGDTVQWTVERAGQPRTLRMVARAQPASGAASANTPLRLRYAGTLGPAQVEVRGAQVNVTEEKGELIIRSRDLLVRVTVPHQ